MKAGYLILSLSVNDNLTAKHQWRLEWRQIVTCILSAALVFTFLFVSEAIEDDAMVLYYSFDEGKGKDIEDLGYAQKG